MDLCQEFLSVENAFDLDSLLETLILNPVENTPFLSDNNNSLVLKIKYNDFFILFTKDVERDAKVLILDNLDQDLLDT